MGLLSKTEKSTSQSCFLESLEDTPFTKTTKNALGREITSITENLAAAVVSKSGLMVGDGLPSSNEDKNSD